MILDLPLPPLLHLPGERLRDLDVGTRLEWIEPDGVGGWASGTSVGANTRADHGLLIAARKPPADRVVLLSRFEETVITPAGERVDLGVSFYPNAVHPSGHELLAGFSLDPWPVWRFQVGDGELVKELFHSRRARATVLRYRLRGESALLELRPLFAGRRLDEVRSSAETIRAEAEASERMIAYQPHEDMPPVILSFGDGEWQPSGIWYYRALYPRERELGRKDLEDLYSPGFLRLPLEGGGAAVVACGLAPARVARSSFWTNEELSRRERIAAPGRALVPENERLSELAARLALAADSFLVDRGYGTSIMSGYPARMDRGRDAMIALPGITLTLGRKNEALAVLRTFAANLRDGLIPARFPESGGRISDEDYGSADASLWFIEGVAALHDAGVETRDLWPAVREILRAYEAGAAFGIRLDADGLVRHGALDRPLTWMDAHDANGPVALRAGKAIEVNALWYNALMRAAALPYAENSAHLRALAERCRSAFQIFWFSAGGYFFDVIDPIGRPDPVLRPNQLIALSLPFSPVDTERARSALRVIERDLLVATGIRTMAPAQTGYRGRIEGSTTERARAAFSGGAWPWLIGPFVTAYLRVHDRDRAARTRITEVLLRFEAHLQEHGIGQISEVCAGDPPHTPDGCIAHAASTGELLRAIALLRA